MVLDQMDPDSSTTNCLNVDDDDTITVTFTAYQNNVELYSVESSVPVSWNVGQVQWQETRSSRGSSDTIQVTDPDMNWNPDRIDQFEIDVWSDSDPAGIQLTVSETGKDTGIFEGMMYFSDKSSLGQRLHTAQDDVVIAEYEDHTLPHPYTTTDKLQILDSTIIRDTPANLNESRNPFMRVEDESFDRQSLQT